jgi:hypothetical protein
MHRRERSRPEELTLVIHDSGVRTGVYAGLAMVLVFIAWLFVANRVSALDRVAMQRNVVTAAILAILFMIPVVRFTWHPVRLLTSSVIAWSIFSLCYRGLCIPFSSLSERYNAMRVFTLGTVVCMILATLSWIVTVIWKARETHIAHQHRVSHLNHHV